MPEPRELQDSTVGDPDRLSSPRPSIAPQDRSQQIDFSIDGALVREWRPVEIALPRVDSIELSIRPGDVISLPLASGSPSVISCYFAAAQTSFVDDHSANVQQQRVRPPTQTSEDSQHGIVVADLKPNRGGELLDTSHPTRIRPPRDVVRLEDRLRWLLEPPLESLLANKSLRFAHHPFAFQLDGVAFLYPRHEAVLADEMGLGKTMQAITAVRLLVHHNQLRRVLLICPKPLVSNWQREFATWAPELPVESIEGAPARRRWLWRKPQNVVTIANYETVVRDAEDVCDPAGCFDLVILDESQRIKNRESVTNQVIRSIPRQRSWALTGTPIENSVEDLIGIFEFVGRGHIHAGMKPRTIGQRIRDHVLRRRKEQVLTDLPPKLIRDAEIDLSPEQAAAYELAETQGVVKLRELQREVTIHHVFELVLRLKQICNFDPLTGTSSKIERLEADLEECAASGRKAIVFSQWVETLIELRSRLNRFSPVEFHGRIPQRRRDAVIEQFRNDDSCHVMLMSYGAGSVGLNLQFANYVFLFDRWWNPAVEDQAINRAHRIGVTGPVTVTRFLTVGTIEERINQILDEKRALFDTVFGDAHAPQRRGLSRDEVFALFDLSPPECNSNAAA